jgi:hypothetical protein
MKAFSPLRDSMKPTRLTGALLMKRLSIVPQDMLYSTGTDCPRTWRKERYHRLIYELFDGSHRSFKRFNRAMVAWGDVYGKGFFAKAYPWQNLSSDLVICDFAGGNGHVTMDLLKKNPQFKIVLQDQEQVVDQAKEVYPGCLCRVLFASLMHVHLAMG